ncbi:MAG: HrcA family transcriptional regulator, partial [Oscillospiraceae bacterium]
QLEYFSNFIQKNLTGLNLDKLNKAMLQNLAVAMGTYMMSLSPLLRAVYELSEEIANTNINIKGEQILLTQNELKSDEIVSLVEHKNELDQLLSSAFDGISIVFGKENDNFAISNSSLIMSPYQKQGSNAGSFGVIGPVRIDYAKIIPHIEYISKSVTKILADVIEDETRKEDYIE